MLIQHHESDYKFRSKHESFSEMALEIKLTFFRNDYALIRFRHSICIIFSSTCSLRSSVPSTSQLNSKRNKNVYFIAIAKDFLGSANLFSLLILASTTTKQVNSPKETIIVDSYHLVKETYILCIALQFIALAFLRGKVNNSIVNKSFSFSALPRAAGASLSHPATDLKYKVFFPCKAQTFISPGECFIAYRNSRKKGDGNGWRAEEKRKNG